MKYIYITLYTLGFVTAMIVRTLIKTIVENNYAFGEVAVSVVLTILVIYSGIIFERYMKKIVYRKFYNKGYQKGYCDGAERKTIYRLVIPLTDNGGCDDKRIYESIPKPKTK